MISSMHRDMLCVVSGNKAFHEQDTKTLNKIPGPIVLLYI